MERIYVLVYFFLPLLLKSLKTVIWGSHKRKRLECRLQAGSFHFIIASAKHGHDLHSNLPHLLSIFLSRPGCFQVTKECRASSLQLLSAGMPKGGELILLACLISVSFQILESKLYGHVFKVQVSLIIH